jgi:imidazole glycerol-phosphate synthase subunit HisH
MIGILELPSSNFSSVAYALERLGSEWIKVVNRDDLFSVNKLIIPGVGSFRETMMNLEDRNLINAIIEYANSGRSILGICLGMQILFESGNEGGIHKGLNLIKGNIVKFDSTYSSVKIPHVGWNEVLIRTENPLFRDLESNLDFYFTHSYYASSVDHINILGESFNGLQFPSIVYSNNVFGVQFHPEKSGKNGMKILNNFVNYA